MAFQLVIVKGRSETQAIRLPGGVATIGRQPGCQLTVRSSQVSRKHCQVFEKDGRLVVKDLGSSNGTFVNGKKVDGLLVLAEGDRLTIGPIEFQVQVAATAAAPADKPGSTAIAEGVPTPVPLSEDDVFDLMIDEPSGGETPAAPPPKPAKGKAKKGTDPAAAKPKAAKPSGKAKTDPSAAPPPPQEASPGADEAVAEFLMNIKLEDED